MKKITHTLIASILFTISSAASANWQALPDVAPAPADNPTTPQKVSLGKQLFMDPRYSASGTVSCNTCHNIMAGGDDGRPVSMGVFGKTGTRNAPTVWNAAFHSVQFWDGRARSLEDQAKGPITNPPEMGVSSLKKAMERIRSIPGYKVEFEKAFGPNAMTIDNAVKAVAAFERTLITPDSAYDRYVKGDKKALSAQQKRGMKKFASTGCTACHSGANFDGPRLPLGQGFYAKFPTFTNNKYVAKYALNVDKGRQQVTGKAADAHMFRVPTLRNITDTAPYFHNGSVNSLNEAVRVMAKVQLNRNLSDQDVKDIVAFLSALSGKYPEITMPRLPMPSGHSIIGK